MIDFNFFLSIIHLIQMKNNLEILFKLDPEIAFNQNPIWVYQHHYHWVTSNKFQWFCDNIRLLTLELKQPVKNDN